jgi:hypothetical protein
MLAQQPDPVDFRKDIRHLAEPTGIKGYFLAWRAARSPKTFMGGSITAKFMSRPGAPLITHGNLAIIVAKDLTPPWINLRRRLDLVRRGDDDRHAMLLFDLPVLLGVPIGRIGRDLLEGQTHGPGRWCSVAPRARRQGRGRATG